MLHVIIPGDVRVNKREVGKTEKEKSDRKKCLKMRLQECGAWMK